MELERNMGHNRMQKKRMWKKFKDGDRANMEEDVKEMKKDEVGERLRNV